MNETQPPVGSPLYNWIHKEDTGSCARCKHLWEHEGLYGCGMSGKFILEAFITNTKCDKYERDGDRW